jgi:quercetin dioxygenase-like cupin family protein
MKAILKFEIIALLILIYSDLMAQQKQLTRKDLLNAIVNQKVSVVEIKEVNMTGGQEAPKHLHACPVVGYIVSGRVLFQIEGQESEILKEGDAFYEPKNKTVLHFDNASKDNPLTFVAFYLKEQHEENIKVLKN